MNDQSTLKFISKRNRAADQKQFIATSYFYGLSVALQLGRGTYPKHLHAVFCRNKQRCVQPYVSLDLVAERWGGVGGGEREKKESKLKV